MKTNNSNNSSTGIGAEGSSRSSSSSNSSSNSNGGRSLAHKRDDELICSIDDADVYVRDWKLFRPRNWLNDSCISYCMKMIVRDHAVPSSSRILLLDPAVASFLRLQCTEEEEFAEFYAGNNLGDVEFVFVPVNDNQSFSSGSSHWSLLVAHIDSLHYWHFDSHGNYNRNSAQEFSNILSRGLSSCRSELGGLDATFISVPSAQQRNGYDCGVYTLLNADKIFEHLLENTLNSSTERDSARCVEAVNSYIHVGQAHGWSGIDEKSADSFRQMHYDRILNMMQT
jgi:Ulp1 family protease